MDVWQDFEKAMPHHAPLRWFGAGGDTESRSFFLVLFSESPWFKRLASLTVPKLVASTPEVVDKERVARANQRLAGAGIEFDYVNIDHGGNIVILKQPAGMTTDKIYPLTWDALADQYEGPGTFTVPIQR